MKLETDALSGTPSRSVQLAKNHRANKIKSTIAATTMLMSNSFALASGFLVIPGSQYFGVPTGSFLIWYSLFTLGSALTFLIAGRLMVSLGVKKVSIVSSIISTSALLVMAFSSNILTFYTMAFVLGITWTGHTVLASNTITIGWYEKRRGSALGLIAASLGAMGIVLGFVYPALIANGGLRGGILFLAGMIFVLCVLPAIFLVKNPPKITTLGSVSQKDGATKAPKPSLRGFYPAIILLTISAFLFSFESVFATVQPAVYAASGVDPTTAGLMLSFYSLCGMVGKPLLGFLHDRFGMRIFIIVLVMLMIAGLPAIAFFGTMSTSVFWILIPIASISLSMNSVFLPLASVQTAGMKKFPLVNGTALTGLYLGISVSAPLWGAAFDRTNSYNLAMYLAGGLGLLGLATVVVAFRAGARAQAKSSANNNDEIR